MKFLQTYKLFENNQNFKMGDFVKIVGDYFDIAHKSFFESNFGQISKIDDDTDYEVLTYVGEDLTNVAHYIGGVLQGNTVLTYSDGNLVSSIFVGV